MFVSMQDYIQFAEKNGVALWDEGPCQFCGAATDRGVHECIEIFSLGFENLDLSRPEHHSYRFFIVDAHALQHPEIHGRWSNHFHLSRLHLIFCHGLQWSYALSPRLSAYLNGYKKHCPDECLTVPPVLQRGAMTSSSVRELAHASEACKQAIRDWAAAVHEAWHESHSVVDGIVGGFLEADYRASQ